MTEEPQKAQRFQVVVDYSSPTIRRFVLRLWMFGIRPYFIKTVLLALPIALTFSPFVFDAFRGQIRAFLLALCAFRIMAMAESAWAFRKQWVTPFHRVDDQRFTAHHVRIRSDIGRGIYRWKCFNRVWRRPDVWILYQRDQPTVFIPVELMSQDLRNLISQKIGESGGIVT